MSHPKVCFREVLKIIPGLIDELITTIRRAATGIFEIEAQSISPTEMEKLKKGKPILHPLFGKSVLIEIEILNKLKGKIIHIKPRQFKHPKAS